MVETVLEVWLRNENLAQTQLEEHLFKIQDQFKNYQQNIFVLNKVQ